MFFFWADFLGTHGVDVGYCVKGKVSDALRGSKYSIPS